MLGILRTLLGLGDQSDYVHDYIARINMEVLRYQTIFFTGVMLIAAASTFANIPPWNARPDAMLLGYRVGFIAVAIVNIGFHRIARNYLAQTNPARMKAFLYLFCYALLCIGICLALTIGDYAANRNFFLYVVSLVIVFGALFIPPVFTLVLLVASTAILMIALELLGYLDFALSAMLICYALVALVVSGSNYHSRLRAGQAEEDARNASERDALTGCGNRRALDGRADALDGTPITVLIGDIDAFKFYNDTFGHASGDTMLKQFASCMRTAFGPENVYRYGGDEFVAVIRNPSERELERSIESWREAFSRVEIDGEAFIPTTSAGYASGSPVNASDFQSMLRIADMKLYDAKQSGRNQVCGYALADGDDPRKVADGLAKRHQRQGDNVDALTGLPSMMYFATHANTLLSAPALAGAQFNFVYFNIENLKIYNERFGFEAGDELLAFTARTIEDAFEHNLVSRFGDDRFVLLTYGDDLIAGIERVHEAVRSFNDDSNTVIRAGIYAYQNGVEVSAACDRAKLACDHIRGRYHVYYHFYEESLLETRNRQQFILDHFEEALESNQIRPYYQPIMRTIGPRVCEFEALARWIMPDGSVVQPADFIPVLEEFRLVHRMDLHILEQICISYRTALDRGASPLPANINLSRLDLELCDIASEVEAIMRRYDIPPALINVEITESAFAENQELLHRVIARFHDLGMEVWMDDFGSGYSSLNVMREFEFDVVKIDLGFLRHDNLESRDRARMMLAHIVSMSKELGIQTLAEGVEDDEQFEFLKSVGCEKVQGFAFGKPLSEDEMHREIASGALTSETPDECGYFDAIGVVDLLHPTKIDARLSHEIELASGLPSAVIEFRDGKVRYLLWNASYLDYLVDIGMGTIENSEAQMNDLSRVQARGFFAAAEQLKGKDEWLNLNFYEQDDLCTAMARCVAVDEEAGASSFVYIAFNISKYLNRTGTSLPSHSTALNESAR